MVSEPVFDGLSIGEHAARVVASVRAINHLSLRWVVDESLPYPSDVAVVVGELARAAYGLRQAAAQFADRIDRLERGGCVRDTDPDPRHPDRAARACVILAGPVAVASGQLSAVLGAAGQDLSCLAYDGPPTRPARGVAPDTAAVAEPIDCPGLGR